MDKNAIRRFIASISVPMLLSGSLVFYPHADETQGQHVEQNRGTEIMIVITPTGKIKKQ